MGRSASIASPAAAERGRAELAGRLEERRIEIERAVLTRVYAVSDPSGLDPIYAEGLRAAISAAVTYGLEAIKLGEERAPPLPPILLAQARMAARNGIGLDTVLRRYFAGHALLGDFLIEEAERGGLLGGAPMQRLLRTQATLFDRLLATVSEEHARERCERPGSSEQRRVERIERLLAGEMIDVSDLGYDLTGFHLGAIAKGPGAGEAIRELASILDRRLLRAHLEEEAVWAWLGGRRLTDPAELQRIVSASWPGEVSLAIGEPGEGLPGWRLTHHQARAALPIALRSSEPLIRYADVALLASILQDDLLTASLRDLYLRPLEAERDGGEVARETLRAYFAARRNVSSAAAALGVSRRTIANRLSAIEQRLDRSLATETAELEAALRLHDLPNVRNPAR